MTEFELEGSFIPALYKPPDLLPIAKHRESLLYLLETQSVTIIVGQTGCGKSTQIPQFLEKAGWCNDGKIIAVTQPRRVAATTVAARVAEEYGCELGKEVGYSIRFEDVTSPATRIKFLTDGLLIREALVDPLLSRYSVIMVDEAHERSISTDILLGLLKMIKRKRPELRLIISSATIEAEEMLRFFSAHKSEVSAANESEPTIGSIMSLEGRTFPIDVLYSEAPVEDYWEHALKTVFDIHSREGEGDILVFMTGREEILSAIEAAKERIDTLPSDSKPMLCLPLYAGLPSDQQAYVFERTPPDTRKVVFSTNIAEASVTIDGIAFVVDTGFTKHRIYNPATGIEALTVMPISRASATQRAGRAGRTRPGKCFRLYTETDYRLMSESTVPEVQCSNLAPVILQLKALGIDNVLRFNYLTPPPAELLMKGLELLYSLGALDEYAKLTKPLGLRMAELAVEPMMAKTLLSAPSLGCTSEILSIAAMTSLGGNVWFCYEGEEKRRDMARRKFAAEEGDHLTLLNVYHTFVTKGKKDAQFCRDNCLNFKSLTRAVSIRAQLKRFLERFGVPVPESLARGGGEAGPREQQDKGEAIRRCLTMGYFSHVARMQPDGTFLTVDGSTTLYAHPTSLMFNRQADWVVFHEVTAVGDKIYIRDVSKIQQEWLLEYAPEFYRVKNSSG